MPTLSKFKWDSSTVALTAILIIATAGTALGQYKPLSIDISTVRPAITHQLTKLGGTNPQNNRIEINNYYITKGGQPIIPITGEFHFSRYPKAYWDESLKKIKAGGVNTVATYVFWNIHEYKEGKFDWSDNLDIKEFVELCAKNNLLVIVRIGPFDHGEIRNGGLPDWLLAKPLTVRTNDRLYLHYVNALYQQIGKQLKGLYYKDGGPIIGVQLENEYQHSASPWGLTYPGQPHDMTVADRDRNTTQEGVGVADQNNPYANVGNDHMRTLKSFAIKHGLEVPIYTATGWGNAAIIPDETLPVTAAYAYPTWVPKVELSPFYLYKNLHTTPDYAPVRYKPTDYPAFAAELGAGMAINYHRRPTVLPESLDALINRCLGSGANGIGYYMYHGGSNPAIGHYFFSDEAYAYPKISYDYQAPIGEYGQARKSFYRLKPLHSFINEFAPLLANKVTTLPANAGSLKQNDLESVRYALRSDGESGFIFFNNFQDNAIMPAKKDIRLSIQTAKERLNIPQNGSFNINSGENLVIPFNLMINGCQLKYATAQLMTKRDSESDKYYVFFSPEGTTAEFCFSSATTVVNALDSVTVKKNGNLVIVKPTASQAARFKIRSSNGVTTTILWISREQAEKATEIDLKGKKHLLFTDPLVLADGKTLNFLIKGKNGFDMHIFPQSNVQPTVNTGSIKVGKSSRIFSTYHVGVPEITLQPKVVKTGSRKIGVQLPDALPETLNDIFLNVDYWGDTGMAFQNNELVADDFYRGAVWEIGLKRFIGKSDNNLNFYFRPLTKKSPFIIDIPKEVAKAANQHAEVLQVNSVSLVPEYKVAVKF